ncbi:hypothetical protein LCGC14_2088070, partial [marine sediment metagenome]
DYFVDATSGDDAKDGLSEANAWKTISKVDAASFSAGDTISFNRGDIWRESLTPPSAGSSGSPITFGAYGTGDKPQINGANLVTTWTPEGGIEDFTTFTEVDPGSDIVVTAAKIAATTLTDSQDAHVYDDKGADHFTTGWSHDFEITISGPDFATAGGWAISNVIDDVEFWRANSSQAVFVAFEITATNAVRVYFSSPEDSSEVTFNSIDESTKYFFTVDITTATNVRCRIWSDSDRASLVTTLNVTVTSGRKWRYLFGINSWPISGGQLNIDVENMDIGEETANVWQAALTTDPGSVVVLDGTFGTKETAIANLNTANEWFWAANILYVFSTSDPDTAFTSPGIETPIRGNLIAVASKDFITLLNLDVRVGDIGVNSSGTSTQTIIDNLTIQFTNAGGIQWTSSGISTIQNCTVLRTNKDTTSNGGVNFGGNDDSTVTDTEIAFSGGRGLHYSGSGSSGFVHVTGGSFHDHATGEADGIGVSGGTLDDGGVIIDGCALYTNIGPGQGEGIQMTGATNFIIRNCTIYGNLQGIQLDGPVLGGEISYNIIRDNDLHGMTPALNNTNKLKVYNNTFWSNGGSSGGGHVNFTSAPSFEVEFRNNIFAGPTEPVAAPTLKSTFCQSVRIAQGILETMPAIIIKLIPLPMPYSSICSPSHIKKMVPAVMVMTPIIIASPPMPG